MSTVTPPPPPSAVPPAGGAQGATATVANPPQALLNLQAGQTLAATLTGQLGPGQVQVETPLGLLTLQTALTLPRGAALMLVLTTHTPQTTVQISARGAGATGTPQPTVGGTATPALAPITVGQSLNVTLVRPALGIPPTPNAAAQPPAASSVPLQGAQTAPGTPQAAAATTPSSSSAPPASGTPQAAQTPQPGGAAPTTSSSPPNAAQGSATAPQQGGAQPPAQAAGQPQGQSPAQAAGSAAPNAVAGKVAGAPPATPPGTSTPASPAPTAPPQTAPSVTLAAGTRFSATVQRIDAPSTAAVTPPMTGGIKPLAQGMVLSGTAAGRTVGGQPIVQTPAGAFALGSTGALTDGAKLTFRLDSPPLAPLPTGEPEGLRGANPVRDMIAARAWQDLHDALKTIAAADPTRLAQVAQNALPQPGAKLSSQMLFLLSALKGGDLRALFGDTTVRLLESERPDLTARLGKDFQTMSKLADEPQSGDWRLALIPLWSEDQLQQLRLFWRHGGGENDDPEAEETRFVVDLDLTHMGHMQIDGLVRPQRHHLDLILRTDAPLPEPMRAEITDIFEAARELVGLGGQVGFQTEPPNFIPIPVPDTANGEDRDGPGPGLLA